MASLLNAFVHSSLTAYGADVTHARAHIGDCPPVEHVVSLLGQRLIPCPPVTSPFVNRDLLLQRFFQDGHADSCGHFYRCVGGHQDICTSDPQAQSQRVDRCRWRLCFRRYGVHTIRIDQMMLKCCFGSQARSCAWTHGILILYSPVLRRRSVFHRVLPFSWQASARWYVVMSTVHICLDILTKKVDSISRTPSLVPAQCPIISATGPSGYPSWKAMKGGSHLTLPLLPSI